LRLGRAVPVLAAAALLAACGAGSWPGGIHALLRFSPSAHTLVVDQAPEEGPAARAGLRAGDEVIAIDGTSVDGMAEADVRTRLRGEVGTRVRLRVRREGVERDVVVERAPYRRR
jgi:carboxyl-terminal processing protease